METWILIWKIVLIGGLALFAVMSVWITFEGWADVKKMFSAMRAKSKDSGPQEKSHSSKRSRMTILGWVVSVLFLLLVCWNPRHAEVKIAEYLGEVSLVMGGAFVAFFLDREIAKAKAKQFSLAFWKTITITLVAFYLLFAVSGYWNKRLSEAEAGAAKQANRLWLRADGPFQLEGGF